VTQPPSPAPSLPKPSLPTPLQGHQVLTRHPASPGGVELQLTAWVARELRGSAPGWSLRYELRGETAELRIPEPLPPSQADGLWQHTCFEAFVALRSEPAYREFNFSPSGQWAIYAFSEERMRDLTAEAALQHMPPVITWNSTPAGCALQAWLPAAAWPEPSTARPLQMGLSAVTQRLDGSVCHWALHHPRPQPDFHHRESFVLTV
jgi:hypothetical protein